MYPDVLLCIDSQWMGSADGRSIPVVKPATERLRTEIGPLLLEKKRQIELAAYPQLKARRA